MVNTTRHTVRSPTPAGRSRPIPAVVLTMSLAMLLLSGCLAEPRTEAELEALIEAGAGSKACNDDDAAKLGSLAQGLADCLGKGLCGSATQCAEKCVNAFPVTQDCHTCLDTSLTPCIYGQCKNECGLDKPQLPCPGGTCPACMGCLDKKCKPTTASCMPGTGG